MAWDKTRTPVLSVTQRVYNNLWWITHQHKENATRPPDRQQSAWTKREQEYFG